MKRCLLALLAAFSFACSDDTTDLDETPCENNDACPADQWCNDGTCEPGTGNECTSDEQCETGEECDIVRDCGATRCSGNTCVPRSCTSHDECWTDGLVCRGGTCQPPESCDDTGNCLDDLFCNDDNLCVPPDGTCTDDGDCPGELICVAAACVTPTSCDTSDDCPPSQNCIQGVCDDPCTQDADCGSPAQAYLCDTASGDCFQRCLTDGQCPDGTWCDDEAAQGPGGLCIPAECTTDAECDQANDEICDGKDEGRGHCVEVVRCDQGDCPPGFACDTATNICEPVPACRTDRDCEGSAYCDGGYCVPADDCSTASCPTDFECIGDVCVPAVCRGNADCTVQGEVCISGSCMTPPSPDQVVEVQIVTPAGVVRPGTTYAFTALALDQAGRAVPGVTFEWLSSDPNVASIDADGLATGGNSNGVTEIRARVQTAAGPVTSTPVELTNLGPAPNTVRVTVIRSTNGTPISGADVEISGAFGTESATSDQSGVATFSATATGTIDVTVAHPSHDYVSVLGASATDLVVPLPPITRPDVAAGVKGTVDLSQVTTQGGLSMSLSGASMPSPLHTFDAAGLFGGDLIQVAVPMVGNIGIPAGNTVEVDLMGFQIPLKTEYYARAQPGMRAIWTFGGRIGVDAGTFGNLNNLLALLIPYFQRFEHGVVPSTTLVGIPTVVDTADFDGDGDTAETIPDWNNFPAQPMQPIVSQSLRYQLAVDNLPFVSGGNANTLVVIAGALLPGIGFVPLGLDGQTDENGNGIVQAFITKMAPAHGGLEAGEYAVIASAVRIDGALPGPGSVRMYVGDSVPTSVDLSDGWLDSPLDATWSGPNREVGLPVLSGADLFRIAFSSPDGAWHVYGAAPAGGGAIAIPPPPAGLVDRTSSATVTVDAVDLEQGTDPATLFDLTSGGNLGIDRVTRGFSRAIVGRP